MRYGLLGIAALATLSFVHWVRGRPPMDAPVLTYLLGVSPNVLAAVAIPFVCMGVWADQKPDAPLDLAWKGFAGISVLTGIALIAWEFNQVSSRRLVFDPHDIGATLVGLVLSVLLFAATTPRRRQRAD